VAFWYNDFYTTLYFVNQRNYKTLAMQAHAFTRTRYFYSLNLIISHPIVYNTRKNWVISPYVLSLRGFPFPPTCAFVTVIQAQSYVAATVHGARSQKISIFLNWKMLLKNNAVQDRPLGIPVVQSVQLQNPKVQCWTYHIYRLKLFKLRYDVKPTP
jgi:hypothetical protein